MVAFVLKGRKKAVRIKAVTTSAFRKISTIEKENYLLIAAMDLMPKSFHSKDLFAFEMMVSKPHFGKQKKRKCT